MPTKQWAIGPSAFRYHWQSKVFSVAHLAHYSADLSNFLGCSKLLRYLMKVATVPTLKKAQKIAKEGSLVHTLIAKCIDHIGQVVYVRRKEGRFECCNALLYLEKTYLEAYAKRKGQSDNNQEPRNPRQEDSANADSSASSFVSCKKKRFIWQKQDWKKMFDFSLGQKSVFSIKVFYNSNIWRTATMQFLGVRVPVRHHLYSSNTVHNF